MHGSSLAGLWGEDFTSGNHLLVVSLADAQRVLSKTDHALQGVPLTVQPAAPRDYGKLVLQGLNPESSLELVELYVEHMLDCERDAYSVYRSRAGDQALVQLQAALSHAGTC